METDARRCHIRPSDRQGQTVGRGDDGMNVLRTVANTDLCRTLLQTGRAMRTLTPSTRLVAGQVQQGTVGRYRVRGSDSHVHVRHRTRDLDVLTEVYIRGSYEPPAELGNSVSSSGIIDLGGNVGLFGAWALRRWDVLSLRSYEPDPSNARLLAATAGDHHQWQKIQAAVSNRTGVMRFADGMFSESRMALAGERSISVPVVDLYTEPAADLVKIDIEGGEWPILTDPRLADLAARAIVMEWHQLGCPEPEAREARPRSARRRRFHGPAPRARPVSE